MSRIVVVGGGIGGCLAALAASRRDPDAEVHLVPTASDRYRYEPGDIGVLGYTPDDDEPVERPMVAIRSLPEDHPYRLAGDDAVREALDFVDDLLVDDDELPFRSGRHRNALVPTAWGRARPTSRYPTGVAAGLLSKQHPMHVVGFEEVTHLDADVLGDRLDTVLPYDVESSTVRFPLQLSERPTLEAIARALDENRETDEGIPIRQAFADAVRPKLDIEPRVGVPAVLGLDEHRAVRERLESLIQADVFEIPVGEPNLPGIRLGNRLLERVEEAGIERIDGTVLDFEDSDGELQSLQVERAGDGNGQVPLHGDAFVLATGDLAAGGLVGTGEDIIEPVFGCPTMGHSGSIDRSAPHPLGDHPFARSGVDVTDSFQPAEAGTPLYDNLFAAGTILGGHNFVREHSRGGVAAVTGYEAGRRAADLS